MHMCFFDYRHCKSNKILMRFARPFCPSSIFANVIEIAQMTQMMITLMMIILDIINNNCNNNVNLIINNDTFFPVSIIYNNK